MRDIKDIPIAELPNIVKQLGLKTYAAGQLIQWLYKKGASSFGEMTNLSKSARETLAKNFCVSGLALERSLDSSDGTRKFAWRLVDGKVVESVLIPAEPCSKVPPLKKLRTHSPKRGVRLTLCISTQVGCAMGCTFCRTGEMGFVRNLTQAEIINQILHARKLAQLADPNSKLTNIVLMGMGEPLANYENVVNAVKIMTDSKCLGLSKRHVTLSTCGLVPEIEKLAKENLGIKLAISLNATTDETRARLMPINKKYPLTKLLDALEKYSRASKKMRLTFEYVLIEDLNDSKEDAVRLVRFLSRMPSKVNLIPLNSGSALSASPPDDANVQRFAQLLRNKHIQVNIRSSRGQDILAACGQLATQT